jgi:fibronectin-binding autotransporter adhesin
MNRSLNRFGSLLLAAAITAGLGTPTRAQQIWSADGVAAGGTGTWTASSTTWLPGPAAWTAGQTGVFSGTSGTITLPTSIDVASGLRFEADGFRVTFSQAGDPGDNFVFSNALNLQGTPTIEVGPAAVATIATLLTGSAGFTKTGQGGLNLVNPFSTFSGDLVIDEGTVFAGGNGVPAAAGAAIYNYHNGNNGALGQLSGPAAAGRQILVNAGGTLDFIGDDTFGDRSAAVTPVTLVADAGLITNGPVVNNNGTPVNTGFQGAFNLLGPVALSDGTLRSTWGKFKPTGSEADFPGFQAFAFRSTVTSSGSSSIESQLNQTPAFGGFHLGGGIADPAPTFDVTDGTLTVSAVLLDKPASDAGEAGGSRNNIRSGFTKSGAGTMVLSGANEYTGDTTLAGGTLQLAADGSLRFAVNTDTGLFNAIGGSAGSLLLDGTFFLDLDDASTAPGTSWTLVDGTAITEVYGGSFAIDSSLGSFSASGGEWTLVAGGNTWTFEQSGGTLSVVPEPSTFVMAAAALTGLLTIGRRVRCSWEKAGRGRSGRAMSPAAG